MYVIGICHIKHLTSHVLYGTSIIYADTVNMTVWQVLWFFCIYIDAKTGRFPVVVYIYLGRIATYYILYIAYMYPAYVPAHVLAYVPYILHMYPAYCILQSIHMVRDLFCCK